jgi:hypothetical protein
MPGPSAGNCQHLCSYNVEGFLSVEPAQDGVLSDPQTPELQIGDSVVQASSKQYSTSRLLTKFAVVWWMFGVFVLCSLRFSSHTNISSTNQHLGFISTHTIHERAAKIRRQPSVIDTPVVNQNVGAPPYAYHKENGHRHFQPPTYDGISKAHPQFDFLFPSAREKMMEEQQKIMEMEEKFPFETSFKALQGQGQAGDMNLGAKEAEAMPQDVQAPAHQTNWGNLISRARKKFRKMFPNALSAACLGGVADLIVQSSVRMPASIGALNFRRAASFASFSFLYTGFVAPLVVYSLCDRIAGHGNSSREVISKVALDQFVHGPVCYIPIFYMFTGLYQGQSWVQAWTILKLKYFSTLKWFWVVWLWPSTILFAVVPYDFRVLYMACFAFVEKCVFSVLA